MTVVEPDREENNPGLVRVPNAERARFVGIESKHAIPSRTNRGTARGERRELSGP